MNPIEESRQREAEYRAVAQWAEETYGAHTITRTRAYGTDGAPSIFKCSVYNHDTAMNMVRELTEHGHTAYRPTAERGGYCVLFVIKGL